MKTGDVVRLASVPFRLLSVPFISISLGKNYGGSNFQNHWHLHLNTQSTLEHSEKNIIRSCSNLLHFQI